MIRFAEVSRNDKNVDVGYITKLIFILFLVNQGLIDAHEQFKATLGEAEGEYQTIVGLVTEVQRLGQQFGITPPDNPYTTLHAQVWFFSLVYIS